jgi:hypothetical protein
LEAGIVDHNTVSRYSQIYSKLEVAMSEKTRYILDESELPPKWLEFIKKS